MGGNSMMTRFEISGIARNKKGIYILEEIFKCIRLDSHVGSADYPKLILGGLI
jgi:hypothetical protein